MRYTCSWIHFNRLSPYRRILCHRLVQSYLVLSGDVLRWEQQVRLRHMTTRKYLCMDGTKEISLTDDNEDPQTVFRLYSVLSVRYTNDPAHLTNSSSQQYTQPPPFPFAQIKKKSTYLKTCRRMYIAKTLVSKSDLKH